MFLSLNRMRQALRKRKGGLMVANLLKGGPQKPLVNGTAVIETNPEISEAAKDSLKTFR